MPGRSNASGGSSRTAAACGRCITAPTSPTPARSRHSSRRRSRASDWDRALAVNLSAAFHTSRLVLPAMRTRNFGRIVNIASIYGLFATVNRVDYVTTKTALIGFTRAVALETVGQNITCNAICPGTVPTPNALLRGAGRRRGAGRAAGRAGGRRHHGRRDPDRWRLERQLAFLGSDTTVRVLAF